MSALTTLIRSLRSHGTEKSLNHDWSVQQHYPKQGDPHTPSHNKSQAIQTAAKEYSPLPEPALVKLAARAPGLKFPAVIIDADRRDSKPTEFELQNLQWGEVLNGPQSSSPPTPSELENSRPATPQNSGCPDQPVGVVPSVTQPYMNRWRVAAACIGFFTQGLNDSAPGALLPYMERQYNISYAIVSLIFVANALGYIIAAPFCHKLNNRFGRARVLSFCTMVNVAGYVAIICQPPFAVVVIAFLIQGFGFATILSLDNVFVVNLRDGTSLLGYMHGCYGIGGLVAPFAATAMVSARIPWSHFYAIPLALSAAGTGAFFWSFRHYERDMANANFDLTRLTSMNTEAPSVREKTPILRTALRSRTTLLGSLFIFAYQGAEVSISGWVISFLIDYRSADPFHVGYVTSGFWGGITLGRFILVQPLQRIGERLSMFILITLTAGFQLMVWLLPNVIGNAVAVAIIGVLLGPVYPIAAGLFSRLLKPELQISALGFISSMGSSGGAIAPFLTGLLAQRLGTVVLNPICIILCAVMAGAMAGMPRQSKRRD